MFDGRSILPHPIRIRGKQVMLESLDTLWQEDVFQLLKARGQVHHFSFAGMWCVCVCVCASVWKGNPLSPRTFVSPIEECSLCERYHVPCSTFQGNALQSKLQDLEELWLLLHAFTSSSFKLPLRSVAWHVTKLEVVIAPCGCC